MAGRKRGSDETEVPDVDLVPTTPPVVPADYVRDTVTPTPAPTGSGLEGDPLVVTDDDGGARI